MMMKFYKILFGILILSFSNSVNAQTKIASIAGENTSGISTIKKSVTRVSSINDIKAEKVDHTTWSNLIQMNISQKGIVDYDAFKKDVSKLNDYLRTLTDTKITPAWTKNDKIAYWINVYNAFTIKLVVNNYPVKSIKEIEKPWDQKFFSIDGKSMSLGEVEHGILRKFGDPRIHFAINCASASCPRLIQVPYTAKNLDELLERQTIEFINDPFYNTITSYTVNVSKLFDWYKRDFKEYSGSVVNFINKYSKVSIGNQKEKGYKPYDWTINSAQ